MVLFVLLNRLKLIWQYMIFLFIRAVEAFLFFAQMFFGGRKLKAAFFDRFFVKFDFIVYFLEKRFQSGFNILIRFAVQIS